MIGVQMQSFVLYYRAIMLSKDLTAYDGQAPQFLSPLVSNIKHVALVDAQHSEAVTLQATGHSQ
jgi:hypothetical protein